MEKLVIPETYSRQEVRLATVNHQKALRLDSLNILKIENLWQFTSLTKLQMDSNMIEQIDGVSMLHNLVWLDLSFNRNGFS